MGGWRDREYAMWRCNDLCKGGLKRKRGEKGEGTGARNGENEIQIRICF